ncbi:hypothetical protein OJAV_G00073240 [Oryzias javanicus]|uniref:Uncharacterized protein n=1 Tax=Oryzias javanicus TaxID=123683 RepID=A0A3S2M6N1_ORYJA|nr:hypothetical protein OJAV_G00073240 [Oryzias javanicus]
MASPPNSIWTGSRGWAKRFLTFHSTTPDPARYHGRISSDEAMEDFYHNCQSQGPGAGSGPPGCDLRCVLDFDPIFFLGRKSSQFSCSSPLQSVHNSEVLSVGFLDCLSPSENCRVSFQTSAAYLSLLES